MSDIPPNVKVFDRPEKKTPSPVVLIVIVLVVLVIGYFVYRMMNPPSSTAQQTQTTGALRRDAGQYNFALQNSRITRPLQISKRV